MSKVSNFFGWLTAIGFFGSFIVPFVGIPLAIVSFFLWGLFKPKKEMDKICESIDKFNKEFNDAVDRDIERLERKHAEYRKRLEELKNKNN